MWKYYEIYCVSINIYINIYISAYINIWKEKKIKKKRLPKKKKTLAWYCGYSAATHQMLALSIIVKILWNLLCQYNNIYKKKKKYKRKTERKKKKKNVATMPFGTVATIQN